MPILVPILLEQLGLVPPLGQPEQQAPLVLAGPPPLGLVAILVRRRLVMVLPIQPVPPLEQLAVVPPLVAPGLGLAIVREVIKLV